MQELDEYIDQLQNLPPAPTLLPKLLAMLRQPDIDAGSVVEVITYEPALTAKVLQAANSACFAGSTKADNLQEALTRLGFERVFRLVAVVGTAGALTPPQKGYGIEAGELWRHSVVTAVAAQMLARNRNQDPNVAFTAGLLHDIGKIVLARGLEHIYGKLVEATEGSQTSLLEAEKKLLGVQHAEVGGRLLARWHFPANLVAATWFHHQPAGADPHHELAACVYLANVIAYFMGYGYGHQAFAISSRTEALEILGLRPEQLPTLMVQLVEQLEFLQALFEVRL